MSLLAIFAIVVPAEAVVVGQVDTFAVGSQDWSTAAFLSIANGGPNGASDQYLRVASNGQHFSSGLLRSENYSQWSGQYATAGINAIRVDLLNPNSSPLEIRLILNAGNYGRFTSLTSFSLPADGVWHRAAFGISLADLAPLIPFTDFTISLEHVIGIGIQHQPGAPADFGPLTAGVLGVDNVTALPEPVSLIMFACAAILLSSGRGS
jgi:hypothetical protein